MFWIKLPDMEFESLHVRKWDMTNTLSAYAMATVRTLNIFQSTPYPYGWNLKVTKAATADYSDHVFPFSFYFTAYKLQVIITLH